MRCLTLAFALRQQGAECVFICREHAGNLIAHIRMQGFAVHALCHRGTDTGSGYTAWLGSSWQTDAEQSLAALNSRIADWLITDHYALDVAWETSLRPVCRHLMVIDDLADRQHDCDILLDQNLNRSAADYNTKTTPRCTRLIGPRFALLRPEFAAMRAYSQTRRSPGRLKNLLISMGGMDKDNVTGQLLTALHSLQLLTGCRITVVMGGHAPWLEDVRARMASIPSATLHINTTDMAQLMADSDVAIGAAGTTAWERCCLGLPTLTLVLAENQRGGAEALNAAGAALLLQGGDHLTAELETHLTALQAAETLRLMQDKCFAISDGQGSERVVEAIANAA